MIRLKQVTIKNFRNFQGEYEFDFTKNRLFSNKILQKHRCYWLFALS